MPLRQVAGRHRLTPGRCQSSRDRAREGLVLAGLDHVHRLVVLVHGGPTQARRRAPQSGVVAPPLRLVLRTHAGKALGHRAAGHRERLGLGGAEAERKLDAAAPPQAQTRGERDVPVGRRGVRGELVGGVEHRQPVAGAPGVADARARKSARGLERLERGHRVVAIDGVGGGVGVGCHRDGVAVDGRQAGGVGAGVLRSAAAGSAGQRIQAHVQLVCGRSLKAGAHKDRVAGRVSQIRGPDRVVMCGAGGDHRAGHPRGVGQHPVGHVASLQVGEAVAVGDHVLERVNVGGVDRGPVDVGQDAVGDREPHLRGGVASRPHAVLAGQVEVALGPGRSGRHRRACGSAGVDEQTHRKCGDGHHNDQNPAFHEHLHVLPRPLAERGTKPHCRNRHKYIPAGRRANSKPLRPANPGLGRTDPGTACARDL